MSKPILVLPTKIPWDSLKGKELEECVYWLLHSMGARDLQWRVGGKGQGAADQGRDLEASFFSADPDGEIRQQRWWVEAKGRSGTVEKEAVMSPVHNASAFPNVDTIVIATNSQFSNPTLDWVAAWNNEKPRPKVRLWDRSTLERHISGHPQVVARLFASALSSQGRLELMRSQFWNHTQLGETSSLKSLWQDRGTLEWDAQSRVAVIVSEVSNGNVGDRAWAAVLDDENLFESFATALVNGPFLIVRSQMVGSDLRGYYESLAYMLLAMLKRFEAPSVAALIDGAWKFNPKLPEEARDIIVDPMVGRLEGELFDICQSDCLRISSDPQLLSQKQIDNYWDRLCVRDEPIAKEEVFYLEATTLPCNVGFELTKGRGCPYLRETTTDLVERLSILRRTILHRSEQRKTRLF